MLCLGGLLCATLSLPICSFSAVSVRSTDQLLLAAGNARLSGHYAQAGELYTSAIRDLEAAGVTDARLGRSLVELGNVREVQGRCDLAAGLILRGIRILEAADGWAAFELTDAWQKLGRAYDCLRQYSKAAEALGHAFQVEQSAPAPRPHKLVELLASQGGVYQSQRKFAEAERAFERAQSILDRNPRIDSTEAALLLNNLGTLYRAMGRKAQPEAAFRRGLALAEAAAAPDSGVEASLLDNLASLSLARKQYRDAAATFERALRLLDRGAPVPPAAAVQILRDYAKCLRKLGQRDPAKTLEARAAALSSGQPDAAGPVVVDATELARK
jgi:tetratricopeptide (TPR) repeat protein